MCLFISVGISRSCITRHNAPHADAAGDAPEDI